MVNGRGSKWNYATPISKSLRAAGGEVFNAATPEALQSVFQRIDEMKKVGVLQKQPQASDYYGPFFVTAITIRVLSVLALFGLRFNPL
jgi:hypothetical protein